MERVRAAQVAVDGERGGVFSQGLVDLDDAERRALFAHQPGCLPPGAQRNNADRLNEPDAADEPAMGFLHGLADELASSRPRAAAWTQPALPASPGLSPNERSVFNVLQAEPVLLDRIARLAGMPASSATAVLSRLELAGLASRHPGARFARTVGA